MSTPLVLTFDVGTQSTRALLVDAAGNIVFKAQKKHEPAYYSLNPSWAEQRPDFYWEHICETSQQVKQMAGERWNDVIAVTLTTIRDSSICIDKDGKPLRDMIVWMDKREVKNMPRLPALNEALFSLIGMRESVELQRKVSACNWIMENEPELWEKTDKFILLSTYLTLKLIGKVVDSTANIVAHVPIDNKKGEWMKPGDIKRCIFDVPREKLCDLVDPGTNLGPLTPQALAETGINEGVPFIACASDKGCETLGLSCTGPGKAAISFGTTATVQFTTDKYIEPIPFMPAYPAAIKNHWNPEVQIYRGYWLLSWFKKEFAAKEVAQAEREGRSAEEVLNERLREVPPGCEGLMLQPYFTPGVVMPKAKGSIIGFSDVHTRIHIYRAIIEGINYALMDGMKTMEKRCKTQVGQIYLGGGGSQSDEICQITANMFGLPVCRIQTYEACGLGSAVVAFVSMGVFPGYDEALEAMVHTGDIKLPDMQEHEFYKRSYEEIFTKIYGRLEPLYKKFKS